MTCCPIRADPRAAVPRLTLRRRERLARRDAAYDRRTTAFLDRALGLKETS